SRSHRRARRGDAPVGRRRGAKARAESGKGFESCRDHRFGSRPRFRIRTCEPQPPARAPRRRPGGALKRCKSARRKWQGVRILRFASTDAAWNGQISRFPRATMRLSATEPIHRAITWTEQVLFKPFGIGKWFVLGFCAFLAQLGQGGYNFRGGDAFRQSDAKANNAFADIVAWMSAHRAL